MKETTGLSSLNAILNTNSIHYLQKLVQLRIHILPLLDLWMVDDVSPGDDHLKIPENAQIVKRISCGDYHVCIFALLDGSGELSNPGKLRTPLCRGVQCK